MDLSTKMAMRCLPLIMFMEVKVVLMPLICLLMECLLLKKVAVMVLSTRMVMRSYLVTIEKHIVLEMAWLGFVLSKKKCTVSSTKKAMRLFR